MRAICSRHCWVPASDVCWAGMLRCDQTQLPSARTDPLQLQPTATFTQLMGNAKKLMCKARAWPVARVREGHPSRGWVQGSHHQALCAYSRERRQLAAPGARAAIH